MIQPSVFDFAVDDEPRSCRVHDIMLDLICELASEENFVSIMDYMKADTPLERKVRRLSIQKADLTNTRLGTSSMTQVRSLTIFSPAINQMLPLSRFEVLRVLDLQGCNLQESGHGNLSCVGDLLHLRYLGLRKTELRKIPEEIGKLLFLQTLDLVGVHEDVKELPASVVQLRNLMYLFVPRGTNLPVGYKNLTSLQELSQPELTQDGDPEELRYLTELRVLWFCLPSSYPAEKIPILLESLGKLHNLQELSLRCDDEKIDNMGDWAPSSLQQFRVLHLQGWYETMPTWISSSSLPLLSMLYIYIHQLRLEDIQVLGALPSLRYLFLQSDVVKPTEGEYAMEKSFVLSADAFPCVKQCWFFNALFAPCMFPQGAMPNVVYLMFGLLVSDILGVGDWDLCIRNLPSLRNAHIFLYGEEKGSERYSEAKAAVQRAATDHPNRPEVYIR